MKNIMLLWGIIMMCAQARENAQRFGLDEMSVNVVPNLAQNLENDT